MEKCADQEIRELRALVESLQADGQRREAVVDALQSETARLASAVENDAEMEPGTTRGLSAVEPRAEGDAELGQPHTSRRTMFKVGAGAAVAAAAVAAPGLARTAAAADGGNFIIGVSNTSNGASTRLNMGGAGALVNENILTVTDQASSSSFPSAVGAYAQGDRVTNGLYAFTDSRNDGSTSTGHAVVATANFGSRSHILLNGSRPDPRGETISHSRGELRTGSGDLWFCTTSGTPGTWRKLAGPNAAGALHVVAPRRAYDSRFLDGIVSAGGSRLVSVAEGIDVETGLSTGALVPAGATSVFMNLTVVNTVRRGFLSAAPGSAVTATASSINWSASGQVLANGTMSTLDDERQLRVFAGGGDTDFIVDVTGYTL